MKGGQIMEENRLLADIVAEYFVNFEYEDVPADVKQHIINILFDTVGLMLGAGIWTRAGSASSSRWKWAATPTTARWWKPTTEFPRWPQPSAAASCPTRWTATSCSAHLSTYIFAAILAEAERLHCTGKQLITAIALGSDIATRAGMSQSSFRIEATEETKNLSRADQMKPIKTYGMGCLSFGAAASLPFAIATAANHIKPGPLWSAKETLENPSILMLMDKNGTEDYEDVAEFMKLLVP